MALGNRLALLRAAAEERGPIEPAYTELTDFEDRRVAKYPALPPVNPEIVFSVSPETRARAAMNCAGLDCETFLIQPGRKTPRLVVTGYQASDGRQAIVTGNPNDPTIHARAFLAYTEAIIREAFRISGGARVEVEGSQSLVVGPLKIGVGNLLVNHNIAFDFAVIAEDAHQCDVAMGKVGDEDSLFEQVMQRIFELLDLGLVEDTWLRERLIDLAEGSLGKDWESLTDEGNPRRKKYNLKALGLKYLGVELDKLSFRMGYSRYHNKSIEEYDEGAISYLTDDVETALGVAARQQERAMLHGLEPGKRIPNSSEQSKAAFSLHLVSSWGMRTDLSRVQQLDADVDRALRQALRVLQDAGLVRTTGRDAGTRDMKRTHELIEKTYNDAGLTPPRTPTGRISTAGGVLEDIALIKLRGSSEDVLDENGQIDETKLLEEPLYAYSQYTSLQKIQSTYLPVLYRGTRYPINTSYETILETGRISSFDPNLNNLPRGGVKTLLQRLQAMVRQCFVPRPGFVFSSVDYSAIELVGLAQVLIWFFGRSKMADAINEGLDLHLLFAAEQLLHIPYEEALARKKEKHVADMRQMGKVANFSLGGGAGAKTLCEMAKTSYNVYISLLEGKDLIEKWKNQWPEMRLYFRLINNMMRGFDEYGQPVGDLEQFVSGRMRGKTRYCATANSFFQGIIADASKAALYALVKACYLVRGALYGSRVVGYFYDEFFMEHPEETAHERAFIQTDIAVKEAQAYLPDVKVRAAPALQPCWYKEADAVFNKAGRLVCWVPKHLQTEDFYDDKGKLISAMKQTLPRVHG